MFQWSSAVHDECSAKKVPHYPLAQAGIWADAVRTKGPVIHNDYPNTIGRKGLPEGHFPLHRHMSIPIIEQEGNIAGVIGVGDKNNPYDHFDAVQLGLFAEQMFGILKQQRYQRQLAVTAKALQESNTELEHFAHVASHDLQEPLRMVASFLTLLVKRHGDRFDREEREFIDYAVDGATRMQAMIKALLDYSRVQTKGRSFSPTSMNDAFRQAIANLHLSIKETGAKATSDDLPVVNADEPQMIQVFQNLIGNAVKFTLPERKPVVHVSCKPIDNGWWSFSVTDNGTGIDPAHFDRVFLLFQRLHPPGTYPGQGIGLPVCKRIVERHGGTMQVTSKPGEGSTFTFTLPGSQDVKD